jgi:hypothetical protein
MLVPHESIDAANDALSAFADDLRELRKKHRIAEVNFSARARWVSSDGTESDGIAPMHIGDLAHAVEMSSHAAGYWVAEAEENRSASAAMGKRRERREK